MSGNSIKALVQNSLRTACVVALVGSQLPSVSANNCTGPKWISCQGFDVCVCEDGQGVYKHCTPSPECVLLNVCDLSEYCWG
jgi:hypothetical protein